MIRWTEYFEGMISTKCAKLQHNNYSQQIGVFCNGKVRAANLITQLRDLNFYVWNSHNNCLHSNSSLLIQLHAQHFLVQFKRNFLMGKAIFLLLSPLFFKIFTYTTPKLLPIESKLKWFKTIQIARKDNGSDTIINEFNTYLALHKWAGLHLH
jgi:hypothetical protein